MSHKVFISLFILFISFSVWSMEGVVTVLNAPLFHEQNTNSKVVQYLRKGTVIWISDRVQENGFLETVDNQGKKSFIPVDFVFLYYNDSREFDQKNIAKDPTDYRIEEPLPKSYPFYTPQGYRAKFLAGMGQSVPTSYKFSDKVLQKNLGYQFDFSANIFRRTNVQEQSRYYVGMTFNVNTYHNSYKLQNGSATENFWRLGVGPTLDYDPFRNDQYRFTLQTTILLYPYQISSIKDGDNQYEYTGRSIAMRVNALLQKIHLFDEIDGVLGLGIQADAPQTLHGNGGNYQRDMLFSMLGYLGIQSSY